MTGTNAYATPTTPAINAFSTPAPSPTDATHFTLAEKARARICALCISLYIIPVMITFAPLSTLALIPELTLRLLMSLACAPSMVHVQVASWAK